MTNLLVPLIISSIKYSEANKSCQKFKERHNQGKTKHIFDVWKYNISVI